MSAPSLTLLQHLTSMFYGGSSGAVRYFASDYMAQQQSHLSSPDFEMKDEFQFDYRRAQLMALFSAVYASGPGYLIYNIIYPSIPFLSRSPLAAAAVDVTVNCPFVFFPMFYVAKEYIIPRPNSRGGGEVVRGLTNWRRNFRQDSMACAAVWIPLHWVNFKYVPIKYRLPFMAGSGIVWSFVMSKMQFDS
ncbi:hypothetical protein TrCOL_g11554 [Triparma columacea]|uniref:Uncharacterized protein n=1 Tax=Triparma columacea TaxID=722753 RepID=A0A9W7GCQ7_9STRA|nr:hypothetical protein TrCOL_g11554 [Triparma columacea]